MFDDHPLPTQLLPVQLVHGVVSVTVVLELNEPVSETEAMLFKCVKKKTTHPVYAQRRRVHPMVWASQHWLGLLATCNSKHKAAMLPMPHLTRDSNFGKKAIGKHKFCYLPFYPIDTSPRRLWQCSDDDIHENKAFVCADNVKIIG